MPRRPRVAPGCLVYHCLNRAVARVALFEASVNRAQTEPKRTFFDAPYCLQRLHLTILPNRRDDRANHKKDDRDERRDSKEPG